MKNVFKLTIILVFLVAYFVAYIQTPHTFFSGSKSVEIMKGDGLKIIAERLKEAGVIKSKWAFVAYAAAVGKSGKLKPGIYTLYQNTTIPEVGALLSGGEEKEIVVRIREGWNIFEISGYLKNEGVWAGNNFINTTNGYNKDFTDRLKEKYPFLTTLLNNPSLEGFLFPDTYRIYKDDSSEVLIEKMIDNFERRVASELHQEIERQSKSLFEILIMASVIEKETADDNDRLLVSGVLWKRYEIGMGLQADATINYIRQISSGLKPTLYITIEDTKIDSPYNTYKYKGLPPGPIGNPGLSAILAAIRPEKSPYLYYLSSPDGKTYFSKTLEEHNIAKAKYLK